MDKNKTFKISGLIGLLAAVGYSMYTKTKRARQQEIIDISPEPEELQQESIRTQ